MIQQIISQLLSLAMMNYNNYLKKETQVLNFPYFYVCNVSRTSRHSGISLTPNSVNHTRNHSCVNTRDNLWKRNQNMWIIRIQTEGFSFSDYQGPCLQCKCLNHSSYMIHHNSWLVLNFRNVVSDDTEVSRWPSRDQQENVSNLSTCLHKMIKCSVCFLED